MRLAGDKRSELLQAIKSLSNEGFGTDLGSFTFDLGGLGDLGVQAVQANQAEGANTLVSLVKMMTSKIGGSVDEDNFSRIKGAGKASKAPRAPGVEGAKEEQLYETEVGAGGGSLGTLLTGALTSALS